MKFRSGILLILLIYLTSCSSIKNINFGKLETGAWGPIEIKSGNSADQFFFSPAESPEVKINVDVIQTDNESLVYPVEALKIGAIYQLWTEGKSKPVIKNIRIRKTCIVYLVQSNESSALWKNCPSEETFRITKPGEMIEDFTVSPTGEWIFYTIKNDLGGNEIWQVRPNGDERKSVFDCSESKCFELDLDLFTSKLVFTQQRETQKIKLLDLQSGSESEIAGSGSELRLSPDGQFLSYLDDDSEKLTIINLASKHKITAQSEKGLMGEWARDSHSILYGEMEFWGGIPGVIVNEMEILTGETRPILYDLNNELEFYQPMYTRNNGIYLASVRLRSTGASRQFWLLREGAEGIKQITTDPLFHYSLPSWSPDFSKLVFQRFPISKSDGHPQVVVWNQDSDSFEVIAENASRPIWLP